VNLSSAVGKHFVMEARELPDGAVIERSLAEPELFTVVFDRYYRRVYGFLSRRVGRSVADDLAAETFVRAFERRASFDTSVERALPWLLGIAVNLLAHHRRSEARHIRALASSASEQRVAEEGGSVADRELNERLVAGLERLDDYDREVLLLYAWGELRYEEIAAALSIPTGTVRSRLSRARRKLRQALEADATGNVVQLRKRGTQAA
jgi:RNA polymerase sigma-70 factor (ECF subfamily)